MISGLYWDNNATMLVYIPYLYTASDLSMNSKTIKDYGNIRIPQPLIEELKAWRQAYINVDNRPMTYECMLSSMLEKQKEDRPEVYSEMCKIIKQEK